MGRVRSVVAVAEAALTAKGWPQDEGVAGNFWQVELVSEAVRAIDMVARVDPLAASLLRTRLSTRLFAPLFASAPAKPFATEQTRLAYIASSRMPSRAANSVQVMKMCSVMTEGGVDVRLIFVKSEGTGELDRKELFASYGVRNEFPVVSIETSGKEIGDAYLQVCAAVNHDCTHVFTRSVLAAYFAALFGLPTSLELHRPIADEKLTLARELFRMRSFKRLVVISDALRKQTSDTFPEAACKTIVAASAADPPSTKETNFDLQHIAGCTVAVGYAGQLYPGKGGEIMLQLAERLSDVSFHVLGGYDDEIQRWKLQSGERRNIVFYGYGPHSSVAAFIRSADILIAPYLRKVVVHGGKTELADWMSPLKLFEYMAAEKPIVCSDLPVLREILRHEWTALLCDPDDIESWATAIDRLRRNPELGRYLASNAKREFENRYTWKTRARSAIEPLLRKEGSEHGLGGPPVDPALWSRPERVLRASATSTLDRLVPKHVLRIDDKYAMLCEMRHMGTGKKHRPVLSAGLLFSQDLATWYEGSANPIFADGNALPWQHNRAMGEWLTCDEHGGGWLLFFCGASSRDPSTPGDRVVGIARSLDLNRWTIHPTPILTIDSAAVTAWRPHSADRIYCRGVQFVGGWWHVMTNCGQKGGPYVTGVVIARRPEGPWLDPGGNPVADGALQCPVWHQDRWYATKSSVSETVVRLAWNATLIGKWTVKPEPFVTAEINVDGCFVYPNAMSGWITIGGSRNPPEGIWISRSRDCAPLNGAGAG